MPNVLTYLSHPTSHPAVILSRRKPSLSIGAPWRRQVKAAIASEVVKEPKSEDNRGKAVVVGAGVGGLAIAGRLARAGYNVILCEKNEEVGGRMQSENVETEIGTFRFDTGPSLLLFPDKYREAFRQLGRELDDMVELRRVDPAYRVHYGDPSSTKLDMLYDVEKMRAQLENFETGAGGKYIQWLGNARASLDYGVRAFIEEDSASILDFVNLSKVGPLALAVNPLDLLLSQHRQLSQYFKDPRLRAMFSYQELYVGLSPYNAPGVFSLLAATELTDGVWYPVGGFKKIRDALKELAVENGVDLRPNSPVRTIVVESVSQNDKTKNVAKGVELEDGTVLEADIVVTNADLPYAYDSLLKFEGAQQESERVNKMDFSCSVVEFKWCLKEKIPGLLQHNVFLSSEYKESWNRPYFLEDFADPKQNNFYVHCPTRSDEASAPQGCESVMVLLPVANRAEVKERVKRNGRPEPSEDEVVEAGREAVLRFFESAGFENFRESIIQESVIKPTEWEERYNLKNGSVFGLGHGLLQLACFRPPVQTGLPFLDSPKVDGLYFVGASTRPGNGVPLVLMGVNVVFDNIMKDARIQA